MALAAYKHDARIHHAYMMFASTVDFRLSLDFRGGRSNYFHGLGSTDYFYESNRYFLPVTLDPITFQFHCDMG